MALGRTHLFQASPVCSRRRTYNAVSSAQIHYQILLQGIVAMAFLRDRMIWVQSATEHTLYEL